MVANIYKKDFTFNNQKLTVEKNNIALQADSSFLVRWNKTVILVTVCASEERINANFLPLTVDFQENFSSVGKIPGGFLRREGRPSDSATLSARMIDRSVRNLFPKDFRHEIQIFINPLAIDHTIDVKSVAMFSASLTLNSSKLPINECFAGVSVGYIDGEFIFNPSFEELKKSDLDMFVAGNEEKINMIEVSANQLSETQILSAINLAHQNIIELIKIQKKIISELTIVKKNYTTTKEESKIDYFEVVNSKFFEQIKQVVENSDNTNRDNLFKKLEKEILDYFSINWNEDELSKEWKNIVLNASAKIASTILRDYTVKNQKRIDQRSFDQIRDLKAEIDYLPMVHGSALFARGATQTLSTVTLGSLSKHKIIDDLTFDEASYFLHHYKSLPFSMGLVQRRHSVSRREIGHGFLGHKALKWLIPSVEQFPYTIRVASEVLASNGSTSQAAICSANLALLSAGVPMKNSIAGIAIGLIKEGENYHLLSDIQAWEDFYGDMDFKIAGTDQGICSIQLDLKIDGLPINIIEKILTIGKRDRLKILEVMNNIIAKPRDVLSENAIKFSKIKIDPDGIGLLIGPSGKNIKRIIAENDQPEIDIQDDGNIYIYHRSYETIEKIKKIIQSSKTVTRVEVKIGDRFEAVITKIVDYGAFIKTTKKNIKGLIHISNLSNDFVRDINKIVKLDQVVEVEVIRINEKQQVNFKLI